MNLYTVSTEDQGVYLDVVRELFKRQPNFPEQSLTEIPEDANELALQRFWVFWTGEGQLTTGALRNTMVIRRAAHRIDRNIKIQEITGIYDGLSIVIRWGARGW